MIVLTNFIS